MTLNQVVGYMKIIVAKASSGLMNAKAWALIVSPWGRRGGKPLRAFQPDL
jgi:hypothetical protein